MKIYSLAIVKAPQGGSSKTLASANDLSSFSFYQRGTLAEFLTFFSALVAERASPGQHQSFTDVDKQDSEYVFHVYNRGGEEQLAAVMVADKEYPRRPAFSVLTKSLEAFTSQVPKSSYMTATPTPVQFPDLKGFIDQYQDPKNADPLMKLQNELDQTTMVAQQTMQSLLKRGETLEDLVARSDQLGAQSKRFYVQAKRQNSCCVVM